MWGVWNDARHLPTLVDFRCSIRATRWWRQDEAEVMPGSCGLGTEWSAKLEPEGGSATARRCAGRSGGLRCSKGCGDPFPSLNRTRSSIKLKKNYIAGFGDTMDFAIVGGRRDMRDEQESGIGKLRWTLPILDLLIHVCTSVGMSLRLQNIIKDPQSCSRSLCPYGEFNATHPLANSPKSVREPL